nr:MAG TPA: hypothetical protein [Caudoviricetes sp.]
MRRPASAARRWRARRGRRTGRRRRPFVPVGAVRWPSRLPVGLAGVLTRGRTGPASKEMAGSSSVWARSRQSAKGAGWAGAGALAAAWRMDRRTGTGATAGATGAATGMISVGQSSREKVVEEGAAGRPAVGAGRAVSVVLMAQVYAVIRRECKPAGALGR